MRVWSHHRFTFPLPPRHRFPLSKYALLHDRVLADGLVRPDEVHEPARLAWEVLGLAHSPELLRRLRDGTLSRREQQVLGLPWSPALVLRARRATRSTIEAARDALATGLGLPLGGGTHHAHRDSPRGFCVVNDVAVAARVLQHEGVSRVLVVDCDVHQGDGTAAIFADDPSVFTLSLNGARNYPHPRMISDLDVELPADTRDEAYLAALAEALDIALERSRPDFAFYLAGADPWEGDALGRLALTKEGLRARDELVLDRLSDAGLPVCVLLAGGYAPDINDTVDINAGTVAAVVGRARARERADGETSMVRSGS